jgi:hypothetical protein
MSSSSSGEQKEERLSGTSFVQSTVKTAIRALSSVRFPTPGSPAPKRNDAVCYDDAGKSAQMQFAEELRSLSEGDGEPLTSANIRFEPRLGSELTSDFPDQLLGGGFGDFTTSRSDAKQPVEDGKRNTFRSIRSAYGDDVSKSPDPDSRSIGRGPERRSLFDENASSSRCPTPPNGGRDLMGPYGGNFCPVSLRGADGCPEPISQDRFPTFLPRQAEFVASEYHPARPETTKGEDTRSSLQDKVLDELDNSDFWISECFAAGGPNLPV